MSVLARRNREESLCLARHRDGESFVIREDTRNVPCHAVFRSLPIVLIFYTTKPMQGTVEMTRVWCPHNIIAYKRNGQREIWRGGSDGINHRKNVHGICVTEGPLMVILLASVQSPIQNLITFLPQQRAFTPNL